jgi:23S rRNA-/tRNA-specific pseudouridylate synthase
VREAGRRLVDVLREWLRERLSDEVPMARVRALVASGGVRVDGDVVRAPGRPLRRGEHVEALLEPSASSPALLGRPAVRADAERILFQDGFVLAIDKPPGCRRTRRPTRRGRASSRTSSHS